jgi:undecaprenyl-phosphate 4-deoxy-4-formamido-L-arabinose transferase
MPFLAAIGPGNARNFGEHNAVMTGLRHTRGAYAITMDDDLQNPPEELTCLYDHARLGGWDVVYTSMPRKSTLDGAA